MREVTGKLTEPILLEDTCLIGQAADGLTVPSGRSLDLRGQVAGDLVIEAGGSVTLRGQVTGDVINRGELEVSGMIVGRLDDPDGLTRILPGADVVGH